MTQISSFGLAARRFPLRIAALSLLSWASGCTIGVGGLPHTDSGSREDRASGGSSSGGGPSEDGSSGGAPGEEGPVTVPFDKLIVQTVQWFDKDITIEKAETTTTPRETWLGENFLLREHKITLKVQNRTISSSELEYENWDLILADGTRLESNVQETFGPRDVHRFELLFADDDHTLEGAHFELNEYTYGEYEPLIVPLDQTIENEEKIFALDGVVGQSVTSDSEDSGWKHEILSARVATNSDVESEHRSGTRAKVGKKLLELVVRSTNLDKVARNLFDSYFHLNVDGYGVSTETYINELPDGRAKLDVPVVFQIDAASTELEIELAVEHGTKTSWKSIHVDLANATPVE